MGTKITITKGDGFREIRVDGHSSDKIVCAGLSTITETMEIALRSLANSANDVIIEVRERE